MRVILYISNIILPFVVFYIFITAVLSKVDIYQNFVDGVKEGLLVVVKLIPTLIALFVSVGVLRASGFFEFFFGLLDRYLTNWCKEGDLLLFSGLKLPLCVLPVFVIRLFSSSAATGLLLDLYKQYGVDSLEGVMASIALSSTEAVLYCLSVYFMSVGITKTGWTLRGALLASLAGIVASIFLANWMI